MKLQTISIPLMEMGKPAQVCDNCGHSPMHTTHSYYKGTWKCKPSLGVKPGYPKAGAQAGVTPAASAAPQATPAAPTPARAAPVAQAPTPAAQPAVKTITPVAGGPSVTVQPRQTAAPTAVPPANFEHDVKTFLETHDVTNYTINPDKSVHVHGNADFTGLGSKKKLPFKFSKVDGEMHIAGFVETLENCPEEVGDDFDCTFTMIKNLKGMPKTVAGSVALTANKELTSLEGMDGLVCGGDFECNKTTKLTSLAGIHKRISQINGEMNFAESGVKTNVLGILRIKGVKKVILPETKVSEILNKHLESGSPDVYAAQEELMDAGFEDYADY